MISEKTFVRYYSSFWEQLLPGVDHYIRMINSGLKERIYTPITIEDIPTRRALINGIAFKLFYRKVNDLIDEVEIYGLDYNSHVIKELQIEATNQMAFLNNSETFNYEVNQNELQIIFALTKRLIEFSNLKSEFEIYPKFQGCGLLFNCSGDIKYDKTLVEIKAGIGNFSRNDIFQLITYGSLNYISDTPYDFETFQMINIRTGIQWIENIESVCEIIGGASSAEIYSEVVNYISNNYRSI